MNIMAISNNTAIKNQQVFKAKAPVINTKKGDVLVEEIIGRHEGEILKYMEAYSMPELKIARKFAPDEMINLPLGQNNYGVVLINSGVKTSILDLNKLPNIKENFADAILKDSEGRLDKEFMSAIRENIRVNSEIPKKGLSYKA